MYNPIERENEIFDILVNLSENGCRFVMIGGYAVSAYRHRFSVDADIVIQKEDAEKFERILKENGYRKTMTKKLENVYSSEFVRYEKKETKVNVDLLIGTVGIRQTGAAFGFDFLFENSRKMPIEGSEKTVRAYVPRKEVLIIMKLHAGRLTDLRDVAALSFNLDMEFIRNNIWKGGSNAVKKNLKKLGFLLEKQEFKHSFKGVFMEKGYKIGVNEIKRLVEVSNKTKTGTK